jgi:hypothetical protein
MRLGPLLVLACFSLIACGDDTGAGGSGAAGGGPAGGSPEGGAGGGGGEGGGGGSTPGTPCEEICGFFEELEAEVMCGYDGAACNVDCEAGFANTVMACHDEAIAYNDCIMTLPSTSWNCTNGTFSPIGDDCTPALDALTLCVQNN